MPNFKLSSHFVIQEFVPQDVFEKFQTKSLWFIDRRVILLAEFIRSRFGKPLIINNWHSGGKFQYRGFRPRSSSVGAEFSQHRFGRGIDFNVMTKEASEVSEEIIKSFSLYKKAGLTTIEDPLYTKGWTHIDIRDTNSDELLIVKP